MHCALDESIQHETGLIYRFRKHFRAANEKCDGDMAERLWDKSAKLVQLDERMARAAAN